MVMLNQLPAEILLEVFRYLDENALINLYQLCRRFYFIIDLHLREICRARKIHLNIDLTPCCSVDRRTLKFVKDLVFVSDFEDDQAVDCFLHGEDSLALTEEHDDGIRCNLMPVFQGLRRGNLVTFRWELGSCIPSQIQVYLRRNQENIECLALKTTYCDKEHAQQRELSISRFHKIRSLSWKGVCMIDHCIALAEFFQINAHRLEELELSFGFRIYSSFRKWKDLQKDSTVAMNAFAFKILQLHQGQTKTIFPYLKKLSLGEVDFKYAFTEVAYALQLHRLRALKLRALRARESLAVVELLGAIVSITSSVELVSLDIEINPTGNLDTGAFQRFFELSSPNLEDLFIHVDAWDDQSTSLHWSSIFAHGRQIKRFVYSRRWEIPGFTVNEWPRIPFDTTEALDGEILALPGVVNLQCVAICDDTSALAAKLSRLPPLQWEILNIRSTSIRGNYYTMRDNQLEFEIINDLVATFSARFPGLAFDIGRYTRCCHPSDLRDLFEFACWAFGPSGLPKLDLLVLREVKDLSGPLLHCVCLCRNTAALAGCVPFRVLKTDGSVDSDVELQGKMKANAEFLETMPSSPWYLPP